MAPARAPKATDPDGAAPRRARRGTGEVRSLILDAARASFDERGYARSTTRDIAARADVAEILLFRNFGSKANLFAEAVLLPLVDLFREWVEMIEPSTDADIEEQQRRFTEHLYRTASENRGLLITFFATRAFEPEVTQGHDAETMMQAAIDDLASRSEERLRRVGVDVSDMDIAMGTRSVIGMILAIALFDDWLLPPGRRRPKKQHIVDELTRQVLFGGFNQKPDVGRRRRGRA